MTVVVTRLWYALLQRVTVPVFGGNEWGILVLRTTLPLLPQGVCLVNRTLSVTVERQWSRHIGPTYVVHIRRCPHLRGSCVHISI